MSDMSELAGENARAVNRPRQAPVVPFNPPRLRIFRPPLLRAWAREAGENLAILGAVLVAAGLPCAVVGVYVPSWMPWGAWLSVSGVELLVIGLGMHFAGRR